jgi:hypothetical protein
MWKENRFGWPLRGIIWFAVPLRSVGLGFAIGLGTGALAVWMRTRNARE